MIDETFYNLLQIKISEAFANSENERVKHFWCDGVLAGFDHEYEKKQVNDNRRIAMKAFCGNTGQEKYDLILIFGRKALSRYARGLDISECIPNSPSNEWFDIDILKQQMVIQLD
jgi:hypothetical protein